MHDIVSTTAPKRVSARVVEDRSAELHWTTRPPREIPHSTAQDWHAPRRYHSYSTYRSGDKLQLPPSHHHHHPRVFDNGIRTLYLVLVPGTGAAEPFGPRIDDSSSCESYLTIFLEKSPVAKD